MRTFPRSVPTEDRGPPLWAFSSAPTRCAAALCPAGLARGSVLLWKRSALGQQFPSNAAQGRL